MDLCLKAGGGEAQALHRSPLDPESPGTAFKLPRAIGSLSLS